MHGTKRVFFVKCIEVLKKRGEMVMKKVFLIGASVLIKLVFLAGCDNSSGLIAELKFVVTQ